MSTTASLLSSRGVSAIPNDLEGYRILGLLHRIIIFLQVDNPKSQVLHSTKQQVLDCSVSLFSRIFQVVKKVDTAQILDVREYKACSETIWKLENTLTLFTETLRRISPVELLDLTLKNHNQEYLDFKEVDIILKVWNDSRANLRKAVDNLRQVETEVVKQLPQGISYEGYNDLSKNMLNDAISILELCCKSTRAELLALYRRAASEEVESGEGTEKDPSAALPDTILETATNINQIMTNKEEMLKATDEHIMVLINHVMIIQVTVAVNNSGKASPSWKAHISGAWHAIKKFSMSVLKKAKKIGQVSIRDLKQETEKDTQEIISVINDQPSNPPNGQEIPDFSSMIISLTTDALRVARPFHQQATALVCLCERLITELLATQGRNNSNASDLKLCIDSACFAVRNAMKDILDYQNLSDNHDVIEHFRNAFQQLMGFILRYNTQTQWDTQYASILREAQSGDEYALARLESLSKGVFPPEPEHRNRCTGVFGYEVAGA